MLDVLLELLQDHPLGQAVEGEMGPQPRSFCSGQSGQEKILRLEDSSHRSRLLVRRKAAGGLMSSLLNGLGQNATVLVRWFVGLFSGERRRWGTYWHGWNPCSEWQSPAMRHAASQPVTLHDRLVIGDPALFLVFGYGRFGMAPAQRGESGAVGPVEQKAQKFEPQPMC